MSDDQRPFVEVDGVQWFDGDIGIAADGTEVKAVQYRAVAGRQGSFYWNVFGGDWDALIGGKYDDVARPIAKVHLVKVGEEAAFRERWS
jgi:hypothetical protein